MLKYEAEVMVGFPGKTRRQETVVATSNRTYQSQSKLRCEIIFADLTGVKGDHGS